MAAHHPLPADLTTGSVALDIGDGAGALLIDTDAHRVGEEIEVERVGAGRRTHVAVLTRRVGATVAHAAVFASLPEGDYLVFDPLTATAIDVCVESGQITRLDWRRRGVQPSPPPVAPPSRATHGALTAR